MKENQRYNKRTESVRKEYKKQEGFNMRKNLGAKAYTYPQPVFILAAYGEDGTPNAMNAAWGGISDDKELTMCISASHKTTEDILAKKAFTVSMADAAHVEACDYMGIVSGTKEPDKFAKAVNISVDERVLDENGKVDVAKAQPITFDPFNNTYVVLGETVGRAFHDGMNLKK